MKMSVLLTTLVSSTFLLAMSMGGSASASPVTGSPGVSTTPSSSSGDPGYDWTFTSGGTTLGSGHLTTDGAGDILTFEGTVLGNMINGFTSGSGDDGVFEWDNTLYTTTPHTDYLGILFDAGGLEWNIYNGIDGSTTGYDPNGDTLANSANNYGGSVGTFNITLVPEPATWAMLILGIGGVGFALRLQTAAARVAAV